MMTRDIFELCLLVMQTNPHLVKIWKINKYHIYLGKMTRSNSAYAIVNFIILSHMLKRYNYTAILINKEENYVYHESKLSKEKDLNCNNLSVMLDEGMFQLNHIPRTKDNCFFYIKSLNLFRNQNCYQLKSVLSDILIELV